METAAAENLKSQVHDFWNRQSCDTQMAASAKFSREYFDEIEFFRYKDQPFIHAFSQFSRYRDKRVLEVGFGAGTDFIQWLRAGAKASGIDLTEEALDNVNHRAQIYGLPSPEQLCVSDAENLPFPSDCFDLGYSFGVLHHTPNTERAMAELVRVTKPAGEIKVMLYNLHSVNVFKYWVKYAALHGRPWNGLRWAIWNHMESIGTKAYTRGELVRMLSALPLHSIHVRTEVTASDYLSFSDFKPANLLCRAALHLAGCKERWQPEDYLPGASRAALQKRSSQIEFHGNRLGFFHCITAVKAA